jgi:aminoglycoside phosphotransferase family enzyme/predicted kinase
MAETDPLRLARERVEQLCEHLESRTGRPVQLVETHISWVLLTDAIAWKLKKPVRLPFLDFTTLVARHESAREELRVNRRLAPSIYLDLADVVETPCGTRFGGPGRVVDVAVRMRRFPDGALWSERIAWGEVGAGDVESLAETLAAFQAHAPSASPSCPYGRAEVHDRVLAGLLAALPAGDADAAVLRDWLPGEAARLAAHFEARRLAGRVREGHGDLHLANVVELAGRPTPFDAIEFDASLRWIDTVEDIAFLAMDLLAHDAAPLAWRFLNAWLAASGDFEGLRALRFHLVCRALVRAQVTALRASGGAGEPARVTSAAYRALAAQVTHGASPRLAITHGLPGSGKTSVARALADAAGAVMVRSDVERKRLFGLAPLDRSGPEAGLYTADATARTYRRLLEVARVVLACGWPVVVDAAFLRAEERATFASLARAARVPFTILDCTAAEEVLRTRVRARLARGADASEADEAVLERLTAAAEALSASEREQAISVDTTAPIGAAALAGRWRTLAA